MNLNEFARDITLSETGATEVSIAQVKEILKLTLIMLGEHKDEEILKVINRYRE